MDFANVFDKRREATCGTSEEKETRGQGQVGARPREKTASVQSSFHLSWSSTVGTVNI